MLAGDLGYTNHQNKATVAAWFLSYLAIASPCAQGCNLLPAVTAR